MFDGDCGVCFVGFCFGWGDLDLCCCDVVELLCDLFGGGLCEVECCDE